MEKIHITIEDGIEPSVALDHVRDVVKHGRISKNNTMYCYGTLFPDGTVVYTNDYRKSDCFRVRKDKRKNKE
jgi:hypothetical protein